MKNASVGTGDRERIEYAIKFPADGEQVCCQSTPNSRVKVTSIAGSDWAGDAKLITHFSLELKIKSRRVRKKSAASTSIPRITLSLRSCSSPPKACMPKSCTSQACLSSYGVITES